MELCGGFLTCTSNKLYLSLIDGSIEASQCKVGSESARQKFQADSRVGKSEDALPGDEETQRLEGSGGCSANQGLEAQIFHALHAR